MKQNNSVTIESLESGLRIDEHALEDALTAHSDFFYKVSDQMTLALSRRDEAKQQLEEVEADVDLELRKDAAKLEERTTEKEIESNRKIDRRVKAANAQYLKLKHEAARWATLKEAFEQRSYALSKLVDLYVANYYSQAEKKERPQANLRDIKAQRVRTQMSEKRHQESA